MTAQQPIIEKTLKRILARELKEWPSNQAFSLEQAFDGTVIYNFCLPPSDEEEDRKHSGLIFDLASDWFDAYVTRSEWEAERALLASEQAQPVCDAEEFDQALWDKVALACLQCNRESTGAAICAFDDADAFMAERAKRIAARKAGV